MIKMSYPNAIGVLSALAPSDTGGGLFLGRLVTQSFGVFAMESICIGHPEVERNMMICSHFLKKIYI